MDKHQISETLDGSIGIRWAQGMIDLEAALLPEELRDSYVWLKIHAREVCGQSIQQVTRGFQRAGVDFDETTVSKILRNRWNRDRRGNPLPNPVVAMPKLIKAIEQLRNRARVESVRGRVPFVMTPTAQSIFDYIDLRRSPDWVNKFGVIVGPTGSQKTATLKEYQSRNNHGQVICVESPENGALSELLAAMASAYGYTRDASKPRLRNAVFRSVTETRTVIVDNAQELYRPQLGHDQPAFSYLRRLQDEKGCTIILSITPTFERTLVNSMMAGYFEQFEGRAGGRRNFLRLPEYASAEDCLAIAQAFGLQDAEQHTAELVRIAREPGRIRRLFGDLQIAKLTASAAKESLEIEHLRDLRDGE